MKATGTPIGPYDIALKFFFLRKKKKSYLNMDTMTKSSPDYNSVSDLGLILFLNRLLKRYSRVTNKLMFLQTNSFVFFINLPESQNLMFYKRREIFY